MFLDEVRYKDNIGVKWTIYSIIFTIISFNFVAILTLFFGNAKVIEESNIESLIINGDIILAIFSLICCYTFYYIYTCSKYRINNSFCFYTILKQYKY